MDITAERDLEAHVSSFRAWAAARAGRYGEWECDYEGWAELYDAARRVLELPSITDAAIANLLYALARDNECELILDQLSNHKETGIRLAKAALVQSDPEARWQLAVFLGAQPDAEARDLLRRYIDDPDEYVRRRALLAAVALDPEFAEGVARTRLRDPNEYSRLAAFSVLCELHSTHLTEAIAIARDDPSEHVRAAVAKATEGQAG